jgi:hypothetical protein
MAMPTTAGTRQNIVMVDRTIIKGETRSNKLETTTKTSAKIISGM